MEIQKKDELNEIKNKTPEEKEFEDRRKKIKKSIILWLKDPYNFTLSAVLISIIFLRFYYFWLTKNQPVWWDESEYLSAAKNYAGIVDFKLASLRLPGLSILISIFYILGINQESVIRFFIGFIPSIILIFLFYFLIKEMYGNKKITLISTIILGVLWENLFYSNRFQTENLSLIFEFLALLIFFKVYIKKEKIGFITPTLSLLGVLLFSTISVLIRTGSITFLPAVVLFYILINQSFITSGKNKMLSYTLITVFVILSIFALFNLESIPIISKNYHPDWKLGWSSLTIFKGYFESVVPNIPAVFLYAFFLGLVLTISNVFLFIDKLKDIHRDNNIINFKSDIFNLLLLFSVLSVFIFLIRAPGIEFRWFFMVLPPILVFTSKGIITSSEFIGNLIKNKNIAIIIMLLIVSIGVYNQVVHADKIIKIKLDSYSQVREAGLWIKQNSDPKDIIVSASLPQNTFYSERKTISFNDPLKPFDSGLLTEEEFIKVLENMTPRYYIASIFESSAPQWTYELPEKNKEAFNPVQAYFLDAAKQQPALVIYEFKGFNSPKDENNL